LLKYVKGTIENMTERTSKYKGNILIVGKDRLVNNQIRHRLQKEGYRCSESENASEALMSLAGGTDVVLVDNGLSGTSVTHLIGEIKKNHKEVMVIVVTDIVDSDNAIELLDHGAYDYIIKPFGLDDMIYSVQRAVENSKLKRELHTYRQLFEQKSEDQDRQTQENFFRTMATLLFALEGKDSYTAGHSRRVSDLALSIGRKMSLSESEMEDLRWGSLLHDIGKVAVDHNIVNKNGKLTSEEYASVMAHPIVGATMVVSAVKNSRISQIIEYHHLFFDGNGNSQKIKGEEIPLLARIVTLADAYDAMVSDRSYRSALSHEEAISEIKRETGTRFDPEIVKIFLQMQPGETIPKKKVVLIADDEECIRLLVRSVLGNEYNIIEASDGQQVVEIARKQHPSLILLDIYMPNKNGFDACCEIKNNPETRDIAIIMLTAHDKDLNKQLSMKVGADDYLTKPFNIIELLDTVKEFMNKGCKPIPIYTA